LPLLVRRPTTAERRTGPTRAERQNEIVRSNLSAVHSLELPADKKSIYRRVQWSNAEIKHIRYSINPPHQLLLIVVEKMARFLYLPIVNKTFQYEEINNYNCKDAYFFHRISTKPWAGRTIL
jgi:hypothetical protein